MAIFIYYGRIVAHDTPYNLKKQHTRTTTRIKTSDPDPLLRYCAEKSLPVVADGERALDHILRTSAQ